jgi:hypothetical protein
MAVRQLRASLHRWRSVNIGALTSFPGRSVPPVDDDRLARYGGTLRKKGKIRHCKPGSISHRDDRDRLDPSFRLKQLQWERDKIDVQLAEKRLEMFELQGASTEEPPKLTVNGEVILTIGKDLGLRVEEIEEIRQFWTDQQIGTKLDWFGEEPPVISIGRKQDIARCRPGDRASLTFVVQDRKDGKRGIKTVAFDVQPRVEPNLRLDQKYR